MKTRQNIDALYQGTDRLIQVVLKDKDGNPVDITGYNFEYAIFDDRNRTILFKSSYKNQIVITDAATGTFYITINSPDLINRSGNFRHQCGMITSGGKSDIIFIGNINLHKNFAIQHFKDQINAYTVGG